MKISQKLKKVIQKVLFLMDLGIVAAGLFFGTMLPNTVVTGKVYGAGFLAILFFGALACILDESKEGKEIGGIVLITVVVAALLLFGFPQLFLNH